MNHLKAVVGSSDFHSSSYQNITNVMTVTYGMSVTFKLFGSFYGKMVQLLSCRSVRPRERSLLAPEAVRPRKMVIPCAAEAVRSASLFVPRASSS